MLTVSNQALNLPVSAIRRLIPYADAAKERGIQVYHLNMGQPDVDSSPQALDAVKNNQMHVLSYTNSAGDKALREGMVGYYAKLASTSTQTTSSSPTAAAKLSRLLLQPPATLMTN